MSCSPLSSSDTSLHQFLQNYQLFAMNDLRGPASASALLLNTEMVKLAARMKLGEGFEYNKAILDNLQARKKLAEPLQTLTRVDSKPLFLKADSQCVQSEAILEDQLIACFEIGGEKRLCLPQIFKTVLAGFSLNHINQACDKLFIYCSRCNSEQLEMFRKTRNLPPSAPTCGLITMTDAERLCMDLLHSSADVSDDSSETQRDLVVSESCIPVYHECFGEGAGFLRPKLCISINSKCIECAQCGQFFDARRFVGHCHGQAENKTCHWGFDRNKWRSYLFLDDEKISDKTECAKLEAVFTEAMDRFESEQLSDLDHRKRKLPSALNEEENVKLRRFSDSQLNPSVAWMLTSPTMTFSRNNVSSWSDSSRTGNLQNLPIKRLPTQKSCPPSLENPDRVVTLNESDRYEKHFVPNIALQQSTDCERDSASEDKTSLESSEVDMDRQNNNTIVNCSNTGEHPDTAMTVLENLAKMENMYLQLLQSSLAMSADEKELMEQKYISCGDSIRRHVVPNDSAIKEHAGES
ncbi:ski oncogene-like [Watersipora subatra]|uniref:ski oncogene-like n=1 Tax=Watersipora subatra TaxID=2589382 RepID=UPI00355B7DE2